MKSIFKKVLYKSLITSEFLILNKSIIFNKANLFEKNVSLDSTNKFLSLNSLASLKDIKQLVSILNSFKKYKEKEIYIIIENKQKYFLLKKLFSLKSKKLSVKISIKSSFNFKNNISKEKPQLILCLDPEEFIGTSRLIKRFLYNNFLIILKINSLCEINTRGTYKIFNDMSDLKKIIFIVSLIKSIFVNKSGINISKKK